MYVLCSTFLTTRNLLQTVTQPYYKLLVQISAEMSRLAKELQGLLSENAKHEKMNTYGLKLYAYSMKVPTDTI